MGNIVVPATGKSVMVKVSAEQEVSGSSYCTRKDENHNVKPENSNPGNKGQCPPSANGTRCPPAIKRPAADGQLCDGTGANVCTRKVVRHVLELAARIETASTNCNQKIDLDF